MCGGITKYVIDEVTGQERRMTEMEWIEELSSHRRIREWNAEAEATRLRVAAMRAPEPERERVLISA